MASEEIRARQTLESPLPPLRVGYYHTTSQAIHPLKFTGTLVEWPKFLQSVEDFYKSQPRSGGAKPSVHSFGPHNMERERVCIGDEEGLRGRFQQAVGQSVGAILELKSSEMYFADFKCSGSKYKNTPDIVVLRYEGNAAQIKVVGELKVPWVPKHHLKGKFRDHEVLRNKIAQPLRDMRQLNCEYGFLSTYEETMFIRQLQSPDGSWQVWYSEPIPSSHNYVPASRKAPLQVSMRMCMQYVCDLAKTSVPTRNRTRNWVIST